MTDTITGTDRTYEQKRSAYRLDFPILENETYLNHAAHAPWSLKSIAAMNGFMDSLCHGPMLPYPEWDKNLLRTRTLMAEFLNAEVEEIGFNYNTSLSLILLTHSIRWKEGDNIIVPDRSFPAVVMPAKLLQQWGVEARVVPVKNRLADEDMLIGAIDSRTKMMIVPLVNFFTGLRLDIPKLAKACRDAGVFLAVDAIQAAGPIKIDVRKLGCHALCFGSPKWMFGPMGIGTLFIEKESLDSLLIPQVGMHSVRDAWNFFNYDQEIIPETRRYECGVHMHLAHFGINPNLEMFLDLGTENTEKYLLNLTGYLHDQLVKRGVDVVTPRDDSRRAAIVTFEAKSAGWDNADAIFEKLDKADIRVSVRMGMIRVSPHFYNTTEEIDRLLNGVFRDS
ncbi:MAG TPA: aminotransferase class V-fold PLP-dependent enzyme [Firmicutes bacterium]|nr:aminotransferase class V-fold PLP-dependent enzyme [Bacillota bacterium]